MSDYEQKEMNERASQTQDDTTVLLSCQRALADCQQELALHQEALLRLRADMENQSKRATRELEKAHKYATTRLLKALLPVKDSLEFGIQAWQEAADVLSLAQGMEMTLTAFEAVLSEFGVEAIEPQNEPFDPERHEAINITPVAGLPPNTVAQLHQKGYLLHGRVIRPARVTVSK